ncbi:uncharacterized protein TNIN_286681 [Trichonephila inaurata madagascariensis]|uniref:Uncharacterized protein n=1 Tax=Trichonephila inaurata madagascariensis TaxID=2747483 RepID=A0A8X7C346_9ARAC|nr:uncharacterized protein TNIN_286681 [Trichonephila inaurata madagascariensis]
MSIATPGPRLTQAGIIPCCCRNLHNICRDEHDLHCRDYDYWKYNRPIIGMITNYNPNKFLQAVNLHRNQYEIEPRVLFPVRQVNQPFWLKVPQMTVNSICKLTARSHRTTTQIQVSSALEAATGMHPVQLCTEFNEATEKNG